MDAIKAVANGNLTALLDTLAPTVSYTVTATHSGGGEAVEVHAAGQTVVIAYGGDQVALYAYGSDAEAIGNAEWAVSELATGWMRSGALVTVRTPDGRTVTSDAL